MRKQREVETVIRIDDGGSAGTRLTVSDWMDEGGAWLYLSMRNASMSVVLTRSETLELVAALRTAIEPNEVVV